MDRLRWRGGVLWLLLSFGFSSSFSLSADDFVEFCTTDGPKNGIYSPSIDCPDFYIVCIDGSGATVIESCPIGLVFDLNLLDCTVPTGDCATGDFCSNKDDGDYATAKCSDQFIRCVGGSRTDVKCQMGHFFDPAIRLCDPPAWIASCGGSSTPSVRPPTPSICDGQPEGSSILLGDCSNAYLRCSAGSAVQQSCGVMEVFTVEAGCLDRDVLPLCRLTTRSPPTMATDMCSGQPDGTLFPGGVCVDMFYECRSGGSTRRLCSGGEVFSEQLGGCDPPQWVPECPGVCDGKPDGTFFPSGLCKTVYIECVGDGAQRRECTTEGEVFSTLLGACDPLQWVPECRTDTTTPSTTTTRRAPTQPTTLSGFCANLPDGDYPRGKCEQMYTRCMAGRSFDHRCDMFYFFDPVNRRCALPTWIVTCGGGTTMRPPPTRSDPPPPSVCSSQPNGATIANGLCKPWYLECVNGVPVERFCPRNEVYSDALGGCDPIVWVPECAPPTTTPPPTTTTTSTTPPPTTTSTTRQAPTDPPTTPTICSGRDDGTTFATGPCKQWYFECQGGIPVEKFCERGEVYSEVLGGCDPIIWVPECAPLTTTPPTTTSTLAAPTLPTATTICSGRPDGTTLSNGRCKPWFIECINGEPVRKMCGRGKVYSETLGGCDPIAWVPECAPPTTPPPPTTTTTQQGPTDPPTTPTICSGRDDGTTFITGKCKRWYIECQGGLPEEKLCEPGEVYSEVLGGCDPVAWVPECAPPTTPPPPATTTTTRQGPTDSPTTPTICSGRDDGTTFATGQCKPWYIECQGGKPVEKFCGRDVVYSEVLGGCDPIAWVPECAPPTTPPPPSTTTTTRQGPTDRPTTPTICSGRDDGTTFAIGQCKPWYIECQGGIPVEKFCGRDEVYSEVLGACDPIAWVPECAPATTPPPPATTTTTRQGPTESPTTPTVCSGRDDGTTFITGPCKPWYIECQGGIPVEKFCERDEVYSEVLGGCDPIAWVPECAPLTTTLAAPTLPTATTICSGRPDGTTFSIGQCKPWYTECVDGVPVERVCGRDEAYSAASGGCEPVKNLPECADCPTIPTVPSDATPPPDCVDGTKIPSGACEEEFQYCFNGEFIWKWCPEDTVFNAASLICESPSQIPACAPSPPPGCTDGEKIPSGACEEEFQLCYRGQFIWKWCPEGTIFSSTTLTCQSPADVPGCEPPTTTTAPPDCVDGTKIPSGACEEEFQYCFNGRFIKKWCPENTVFDASTLVCAAPEAVSSCIPDDPPETETCDELSKQSTGACEEEFLLCFNGIWIWKWCPENTIFDPLAETCRSPADVSGCQPAGCVEGLKIPSGACEEEFQLCFNGVFIWKWCPEDTVFDSASLTCQSPAFVATCPTTTQAAPPGCVEGEKIPSGACEEEFQLCFNGQFIWKWCPEGTIFSSSTLTCQSPVDVPGCEPPTTTTAAPDCVEFDKYPSGPCEEQFQLCFGGTWIWKWCPTDTVFDAVTLTCRSPSVVASCPQLDPPPTICITVDPPTEDPSNPCAGKPDNFLHPLGDCNQEYCLCMAGKPVWQSCDVGYVFEAEWNTCVAASTAPSCGVASNPPPTEDPLNPCAGRPDNFRHALGDCNQEYCVCMSGMPVWQSCDDGQVYEAEWDACVEAASAPSCGSGPSTEGPFNPCAGKPDNFLHPLGPCIQEYCLCMDGKPVWQSCDAGYVFEAEWNTCVPEATCGLARDPTEDPLNPCAGRPDNFLHPLGICKQEYCLCMAGKPVWQSCDAGYLFESQWNTCVAAATCGVVPSDTPPSDNPCLGLPDNTRHELGDCNNEYCVCIDGMPVWQQCGQGLVYEADWDACVPAAEVPQCAPPPTEDPLNPCANKPDNFLHPLGPCNQEYCLCMDGKPVWQSCDVGDVFEPEWNTCVAAVSAPSCGVSKPPSDNPCELQPDGTRHQLGACNREYCVCIDQMPVWQQCGDGQVFEGDECVAADGVASCGGSNPTLPTPPPPGLCVGQPDGTLHALGDCNREYCVCMGGKPVWQQCDAGQVFEALLSSCVLAERAPSCNVQTDPPSTLSPCAALFAKCFLSRSNCLCQPGEVYDACRGTCVPAVDFTPTPSVPTVVSDPPTTAPTKPPFDPSDADCAGRADGTRVPTGNCVEEYVECVGGRAERNWCDDGDAFDGQRGVCVPFIKCLSSTIRTSAPSATTPAAPEMPDCLGMADGSKFASGVCLEVFAECVGGELEPRWCEEGTLFDARHAACVPSDKCSGQTAPPPTVSDAPRTTPSLPPTDPECDGLPTGAAIGLGECKDEYVECVFGRALPRSCPIGTVFDLSIQFCVSIASLPQCEEMMPTTRPRDAECADVLDGDVVGLIECDVEYVECVFGRAVPRRCANGTVFDLVALMCVSPATLPNCKELMPTPTPRDAECADVLDGDSVAKGDCLKDYIECVFGRAVERTCSPGTVFDAPMQVCVLPDDLPQCARLTTPASPGAGGAAGFCTTQKDGFFRHPTDCDKFVQCFRRATFVLNCASGLVFNTELETCDFPTNVPECDVASTPQPDEPSTTDLLCVGRPEGAFFRDPDNCALFHRCVFGKAADFDCPQGTVFDETTSMCDFPDKVPACVTFSSR